MLDVEDTVMVHPRLAAILEPHLSTGERLVDASISQIPRVDKTVVAAGVVGGLVGAALAQRMRSPDGPPRRGNAVSGPVALTDRRILLLVGREVESLSLADLVAVEINDTKAVPMLRVVTLRTTALTRILYLPSDEAKRLVEALRGSHGPTLVDSTHEGGLLKAIPVTVFAVAGLLPLLVEGLSDDPEAKPLLIGVGLLSVAIGSWWLLFGRRLAERRRQRAAVRRAAPRPPRPRASTPHVPAATGRSTVVQRRPDSAP